jgi:hypothetical protein
MNPDLDPYLTVDSNKVAKDTVHVIELQSGIVAIEDYLKSELVFSL